MGPSINDVRMRGFAQRTDVADVVQLLDARLRPLPAELIELPHVAGRVLAEEVLARAAVPGFDRAAMDGYAVLSEDTTDVEPSAPADLAVIGEALPARPFRGTLAAGQAVRIMTGAPIPDSADAIAQAEITAAAPDGQRVRILEPVAPGRHIGKRGEDIEEGAVLFHAGRRLRPQDVGVLASVGASPVPVVAAPTAVVLVTGDELLPCGERPRGFQIVDSNSVMLAALLRRDGAKYTRVEMVRDGAAPIRAALAQATEDVVLVTGGSSVGQEDHAPRVLAELGELAVHGIAIRPAGPTGIGFLHHRAVFLLPGNPVSCLCAYDLFAARAVRILAGRDPAMPYPVTRLPLAHPVVSPLGRTDYLRVHIRHGGVEPLPLIGASILSSTTRADGFVLVPADVEGYAIGEMIDVYRYDP